MISGASVRVGYSFVDTEQCSTRESSDLNIFATAGALLLLSEAGGEELLAALNAR